MSADASAPDQLITVKRSNVSSMQPSPVSLMPDSLIDTLNRNEALDLLAYIMSRGNREATVFRSER